MKKLSLVLLLWLSAFCLVFGQVSSAKRTLFNEANNTIGKRVPSSWKENDGLFYKSLNFAVGVEYSAVQVKGNLVELAIVGCVLANKSDQAKWLKESYDTLIADKWALVSGNADDFILSKSDRYVTSSASNDGSGFTVSVVFMTKSTAESAAAGGNTGGKTWTAVDVRSIFYPYVNVIAYGNNKFVAAGWKDRNAGMAYSADGITWTAVSVSKFDDTNINAIAYGNNRFVAGNSNGKMAYSTNGSTWTAVSDAKFGTSAIKAIAYGNNRFVAGGYDGNIGRMATSTNGSTWTAVDVSKIFGTSGISAIAYGNNRFVAGASGGKMATSTDGTNWTAVSDSKFVKGDFLNAIVYGNNRFVAVGYNDDNSYIGKIATSTDGITWAAADVSKSGLGAIFSIAYGNNKFVAAGLRGKMATSTDGTNWTAVDVSKIFGTDNESQINAIAYGNNKFVACYSYKDDNGGKIAYLPD